MIVQPTIRQSDFLDFQQKNPVVSRLWKSFYFSDCKRRRPRNYNDLTGYFSTRLKNLVALKTKKLDNHLARIPITPVQQWKHEMREEVLCSAGTQVSDTCGYELLYWDDNGFFWENPPLQVDAVFRPIKESPFPPKDFENVEKGGSEENPILVDNEENNEISPHMTPVSERPNRLLALLQSCPFETRTEFFWNMFAKTCFKKYYCVSIWWKRSFKCFILSSSFPKTSLVCDKIILVSPSMILLVGASFCRY